MYFFGFIICSKSFFVYMMFFKSVIYASVIVASVIAVDDQCNRICKENPTECNQKSGSWCKKKGPADRGTCHGMFVERSDRRVLFQWHT